MKEIIHVLIFFIYQALVMGMFWIPWSPVYSSSIYFLVSSGLALLIYRLDLIQKEIMNPKTSKGSFHPSSLSPIFEEKAIYT